MGKEEIIKILEDYEYFVDDDFGGYYEHINCKQRAFTPLGILEILDYIDNLQTQLKKQQEIIDKIRKEVNEQHTIMGCEVVENWVLLQILEDKEV